MALFLFLSSCQVPTQWELSETITCFPSYNSARMYFPDESICGLELELDAGISGLRMYVNVFSIEVPSLRDNPYLAKVTVNIGEDEYFFLADLLQGGQRLLLPEEARDIVIEALLAGSSVKISTGRYSGEIPPTDFACKYQRLRSVADKYSTY